MTQNQTVIFAILAVTIGLFLWGRWRHDVVALASLLACVFTGLVPVEIAFSGLGHPAVITVACVLVLSGGLQATGAVDAFAQRLLPKSASLLPSLAALIGLGAVLSAFMNNVGAMALLMPVAIQMAAKHEIPPGRVLMPLAFGTILGGMTTLIGTPPNLIVSGFRAKIGVGSFAMFDFSSVGLAIVAAGGVFLVLLGWRLVPVRREAGGISFNTGSYFTEVRITAKAKVVGRTLREVEQDLEEADAQVVGMVRNDFRVSVPNPGRIMREGDILVIEADPEALSGVLARLDLELAEDVPVVAEDEAEENAKKPDLKAAQEDDNKEPHSNEVELLELVVMTHSGLVGRSASDILLRTRFSLNLLAISRQGRASIKRLRTASILAGDVLLLQGAQEAISGFAATFNCCGMQIKVHPYK